MPSFCQDLKTRYEYLQKLRTEFTRKYSIINDSGDLQEMKRLRKDLEGARDAFLDRITLFTIPNAKNPYFAALIDAGLDLTKTQEQEEMTVDIRKEIQRQLAIYREAKDDSGNPCLKEWVQDITENERAIYAAITKDRVKIMERIKAGMIPIVMPGKRVQERTWLAALTNLQPIWMQNGAKITFKNTDVDHEYKTEPDITKIKERFFKDIPDRPYLVWIDPTNEHSPDTMDESFVKQEAFYKTLVEDRPNLYDPTDIIPTEYVALQAIFTSMVRQRFQERVGTTDEPMNITPLDADNNTCTYFLSAGMLSARYALCAFFVSENQRLFIAHALVEEDDPISFRPASRT